MAISFEKHRKQIEEAWKDVLDDKTSTDWCGILNKQRLITFTLTYYFL